MNKVTAPTDVTAIAQRWSKPKHTSATEPVPVDDPYADVPPPLEAPETNDPDTGGSVVPHTSVENREPPRNRRSTHPDHQGGSGRGGGEGELQKSGSGGSGNQSGTTIVPSYADVPAILDGTAPAPPQPTIGKRTDGCGLFYVNQFNYVFGDPESGKTFLCLHCAAEELNRGGKVIIIDLDHNGASPTVFRLLELGANEKSLRDLARFRFVEPDDARELLAVVADMTEWKPSFVVVDSIGELLPMFGASSNNPDDFTKVHQRVIKPLVKTEACVIGIDHLAKNESSKAYGGTGTAAKKRAIGGSSIRVSVDDAFTPGKGGSAWLALNKDRHGGLRANCPSGDKEPVAGKFVLWQRDGRLEARIKAPDPGERNPSEQAPGADLEALSALTPPPKSANDAQTRLGWNRQRTLHAFKAWKVVQNLDGGSGNQSGTTGTAIDAAQPARTTTTVTS